MAKKLYYRKDAQGNICAYSFYCPGCKCHHEFLVAVEKQADGTPVQGNHPQWKFDGNMEKPTFSPSLLYRLSVYPSGNKWPTDDEHARIMAGETLPMKNYVCHSFVRNGRIQFLGDCTHAMAGQTVDMDDIDDE